MNPFITTLTVNFHCMAENEEAARQQAIDALPNNFDLIDDDTKQTPMIFEVGDEVVVIPKSDDLFCHEFTGHVVSIGEFIVVKDQEDNVYDMDYDQVQKVEYA